MILPSSITECHSLLVGHHDLAVGAQAPNLPARECRTAIMAAALIDRLVHHCHIVNIRGNSYRMREHRALASRLAPTATPEPSPDTRERRPRRQEA